MPAFIVFAALYVRNLIEMDGIHVRALAATHMDMDQRRYRKTHPLKGSKP